MKDCTFIINYLNIILRPSKNRHLKLRINESFTFPVFIKLRLNIKRYKKNSRVLRCILIKASNYLFISTVKFIKSKNKKRQTKTSNQTLIQPHRSYITQLNCLLIVAYKYKLLDFEKFSYLNIVFANVCVTFFNYLKSKNKKLSASFIRRVCLC